MFEITGMHASEILKMMQPFGLPEVDGRLLMEWSERISPLPDFSGIQWIISGGFLAEALAPGLKKHGSFRANMWVYKLRGTRRTPLHGVLYDGADTAACAALGFVACWAADSAREHDALWKESE